jgi:formate-dependent nitrite reductase membrane component NrfD
VGDPQDEGAARTAFLVAFPTFAICPILLTLDLGQPIRFWHMLLDARTGLPTFKYWSPMSVGAWVLFVFGLFATLSFIEALVLDSRLRNAAAGRCLASGFGRSS